MFSGITCVIVVWLQGILLVYDITNKWSFDNIDRWIKEIDEVRKKQLTQRKAIDYCCNIYEGHIVVVMVGDVYSFVGMSHAGMLDVQGISHQ